MAKPATVFQFATDANFSAGAFSWSSTPTKVAPAAGLIAQGWVPTAKGAAQNFNWALNLLGQWCVYFDSGNWIDDITIDGTLTVGPTVPGLPPALTVNGNLDVNGTSDFSDDITLATDKTVNLIGLGKVNHGDKCISYYPINGFFDGSGTYSISQVSHTLRGTFSTVGGVYWLPLDGLKPGDRVKRIIVAWSSPVNAPSVQLVHNYFDTPLQLSCTQGSDDPSFTPVTLTEYAVDTPTVLKRYVVASGGLVGEIFARRAMLRITANQNSTVLYGISITYDSIDEVVEP